MAERKPRIMVAIPTMQTVPIEFMECMLNLEGNGDTSIRFEVSSLIYNARSHLMKKAMEIRADYIMWFDSDMIFTSDTLRRLLSDCEQGMDIVSGLYFMRGVPTKPVLAKEIDWDISEKGIKHNVEYYLDYPKNQIFEIAGCGFGCVMTKVQTIYEVANSYGMSPFDPLPGLGEDYSFCWRMRNRGIKIYCDSSVKCGHLGTRMYDEKLYEEQKNEKTGNS